MCLFDICKSLMRCLSVLLPFLNLVVSYCSVCEFFVYFGHKFSIRYMFCKYFLPVYGLFFHSLNNVFTKQNFKTSVMFHLPKFFFMDYTFGIACKNSLPSPRSLRFLPMLPSRSFIVSCFTFMSMVHFELVL